VSHEIGIWSDDRRSRNSARPILLWTQDDRDQPLKGKVNHYYSALNEDGNSVDWWFAFKLPSLPLIFHTLQLKT
jgi:hypothetical protein